MSTCRQCAHSSPAKDESLAAYVTCGQAAYPFSLATYRPGTMACAFEPSRFVARAMA